MPDGSYSETQLRNALEAYGVTADAVSYMTRGTFAEVYRVKIGEDDFVARVRSPEAKAEDVVFSSYWAKEASKEVKERQVPPQDIERAIERKLKFQQNPERHSHQGEV